MKTRIFLFLMAFVPFCGALKADMIDSIKSMWSDSKKELPAIKVLILHDQDAANLEVKGKYTLEDPYANNKHISTRLVGKAQVIQAISSGLKWGEEFPGLHQIQITPTTSETQIFVNGVEYKGKVQVYNIGRTISIVNELPVEQYLSFLLPEQYPEQLPDEVLAALTITARTNAYYQALFPKTKFWGVDARQIGYKGAVAVDANQPIQKALKNTRNMVMSQTSTYERVVTPFAAQWETAVPGKAVNSQISITEAADMAKKGAHAANILEKAFPRTTIQLMQ